jgi:hypothetical protein
MRNTLLILFSFLYLYAYNQSDENDSGLYVNYSKPQFFIGLSTGLNNFCGTTAGAGISTWGYKVSGGLYYYQYIPYGTYFGFSVSCLTGSDSTIFPMSVKGSDSLRNVAFSLKTVYTINLTLGYQFTFGNRGRFYFELGYALPLQQGRYRILTSDIKLTDSSNQLLDLIEPGGIIFGFGFSYRL